MKKEDLITGIVNSDLNDYNEFDSYSFKDDQQELALHIQECVESALDNLVSYLKYLESSKEGRGTVELNNMLKENLIDIDMHDTLLVTLTSKNKDYKINLISKK
jgi:vacuolar-type H+-ATPase subunit E/Vma4